MSTMRACFETQSFLDLVDLCRAVSRTKVTVGVAIRTVYHVMIETRGG